MLEMMREPRMRLTYGVMLAVALSVSLRQALMVHFISHNIESTDVKVKFR